MNLLFVGERTESDITALASSGDFTYAAVGSDIVVFKRSKRVDCLAAPESSNDNKSLFTIFQILIVGDVLMAACSDNTLRIWNKLSLEHINDISLPERFMMTYVMHPSTYLNKIIIASQSGQFQLWNINTMYAYIIV
jgi:U3 small nucleolar RNA-associated protein 21